MIVKRVALSLPTDRLRSSLRLIQGNPDQILPSINAVIGEVSNTIDRRIIREIIRPANLPKSDHDVDISRSVNADYYSQPRPLVRGALGPSLVPELEGMLVELVGKRRSVDLHDIPQHDPRGMTDFIGSFDDFLAALFWEEIDSISAREQDLGTTGRYHIMAQNSGQQAEIYLGRFGKLYGHFIHGLRAKDPTDRWAYYHVFVEKEKEKKFMSDIVDKNARINLNDYGGVVFSSYEDDFRRHQQERAHRVFSDAIARYKLLQEQARGRYVSGHSFLGIAGHLGTIGWITAAAASFKPFAGRRFKQALTSEGSGQELARLLAEFRTLRLTAQEQSIPLLDDAIFLHWVNDDISAEVITLIEQFELTLDHVCELAKLLTAPAKANIQGVVNYLHQLTQRRGGVADALNYLRSLGRGKDHGSPVVSAELFSPTIKGRFNNFVQDQYQASPDDIAYGPMLLMLFLPAIFEEVQSAAGQSAPADNLNNVETIVKTLTQARDRLFRQKVPSDINLIDLSYQESIERVIIQLSLILDVNSPRYKTIIEIFNSSLIIGFHSISAFGPYINKLEQSHRLRLLKGMIRRSLTPVFDKVGLAAADRDPFVDEIAQRLIGLEPRAPLGPMLTHDELEAENKLYSQAYQRDNSTNIINHLKDKWMPWIKTEALTMPELRTRDFSAYKALMAWRTKNSATSIKEALGGYDIPTKAALVERRIEQEAELPQHQQSATVRSILNYRRKKGDDISSGR